MGERMIAISGRHDYSADALEDHCTCMGRALAKRGARLHFYVSRERRSSGYEFCAGYGLRK